MTNEWFFSNGKQWSGALPSEDKSIVTVSYFDACSRCFGSGSYPSPLWDGKCLKCNAAGRVKVTARIYTAEALARLQARREKKEAARKAKFLAEKAAEAARVESEKAQFISKHPGLVESLRVSKSAFVADLVVKFDALGTLTEKQVAAAQSALQEEAAQAAKPNEHVGKVGDKIGVAALVTNVYEGSSRFGSFWLVSFEDAAGRAFLWKASSCPSLEKGDRKALTGTIKEHGEYKGRKQTVLTRCKF